MDYARLKIPSAPRIARETLTRLDQDAPSFRALAQSIECDPGMVASVLRLANSAAFGATLPTSDLNIALGRIGLSNIRQICAEHIKEGAFPSSTLMKTLPWEELWSHAALSAQISIRIAKLTCDNKRIPSIHVGSLFQDIGYFVLGQSEQNFLGNLLSLCDKKDMDLLQLEDELGFDLHETIAQRVLSEWNFPISTASIVRHHEAAKRTTLPTLSDNTLKSVICVATSSQLAYQLQKSIPYFSSAVPVPDSHWRLLDISKESAMTIARESYEFLRATKIASKP